MLISFNTRVRVRVRYVVRFSNFAGEALMYVIRYTSPSLKREWCVSLATQNNTTQYHIAQWNRNTIGVSVVSCTRFILLSLQGKLLLIPLSLPRVYRAYKMYKRIVIYLRTILIVNLTNRRNLFRYILVNFCQEVIIRTRVYKCSSFSFLFILLCEMSHKAAKL